MTSTTPVRIADELSAIQLYLDNAKIHNDLLYKIALDPSLVCGGEHVPGEIFDALMVSITMIHKSSKDLENRISASIMRIVNDQNKETTNGQQS